jgi:hypothetical protein
MITLGYSKNLLDKQPMFKGEINHTNCVIDLFKHESALQGKIVSGGIEWNSGYGCQDIS